MGLLPVSVVDCPERDNPLLRATARIRRKPVAFAVAVVFLFAPLAAFLVLPVLLTIGSGLLHQGEVSLHWFRRTVANEMLMTQLVNGVSRGCQ